MKLAYTMAPGRGDTDLVLERLATELASRGLRCCGTVVDVLHSLSDLPRRLAALGPPRDPEQH